MEEFIITACAALGLSAVVLWIKSEERLNSFLTYLLFAIVLLYSMEIHEDKVAGQKLTAMLLILISANWILSQVWKNKWTWVLGVISLVAFLFWQNVRLEFLEYPLVFDSKNALLIPFVGAFFPVLIRFKSNFLSRFFSVDPQQMNRALSIIGIGILTLAAYFFASSYGIILAAVGYFSTESYLNSEHTKTYQGSIVLFLLSFLFLFIKSSEVEVASFLYGSTIIGLLSGFGIAWWISMSDQIPQNSYLKKALFFLIPLLIIFGLIFLEKIKEHTGGLSAFSGVLVGLGMGLFHVKKSSISLFLAIAVLTMGCGLYSLPHFKPVKQVNHAVKHTKLDEINANAKSNDTTDIAKNKKVEVFELPAVESKTLEGTWKISSEASKLEFELGPSDTRTKGEFREINGNFKFNQANELEFANIELPLTGFSTFNDFRDEGMMEAGAGHFDAASFPTIQYKAKSWISKKDSYILKGEFTMKGISGKMNIPLKLLDQGEDKKGKYLLFVGKSTLDRTKFGMESDPKIGDLVDFNFTIELRLK